MIPTLLLLLALSSTHIIKGSIVVDDSAITNCNTNMTHCWFPISATETVSFPSDARPVQHNNEVTNIPSNLNISAGVAVMNLNASVSYSFYDGTYLDYCAMCRCGAQTVGASCTIRGRTRTYSGSGNIENYTTDGGYPAFWGAKGPNYNAECLPVTKKNNTSVMFGVNPSLMTKWNVYSGFSENTVSPRFTLDGLAFFNDIFYSPQGQVTQNNLSIALTPSNQQPPSLNNIVVIYDPLQVKFYNYDQTSVDGPSGCNTSRIGYYSVDPQKWINCMTQASSGFATSSCFSGTFTGLPPWIAASIYAGDVQTSQSQNYYPLFDSANASSYYLPGRWILLPTDELGNWKLNQPLYYPGNTARQTGITLIDGVPYPILIYTYTQICIYNITSNSCSQRPPVTSGSLYLINADTYTPGMKSIGMTAGYWSGSGSSIYQYSYATEPIGFAYPYGVSGGELNLAGTSLLPLKLDEDCYAQQEGLTSQGDGSYVLELAVNSSSECFCRYQLGNSTSSTYITLTSEPQDITLLSWVNSVKVTCEGKVVTLNLTQPQ